MHAHTNTHTHTHTPSRRLSHVEWLGSKRSFQESPVSESRVYWVDDGAARTPVSIFDNMPAVDWGSLLRSFHDIICRVTANCVWMATPSESGV